MSHVLSAEMEGSADLDFEVSLPDIPIDQTEMSVQMGQDGTAIELRDREKHLLMKLDGHQLHRLHADGRINVSRPDTLRQSVYNYWTSQRKPPDAPTSFRFVVKADDTVEHLVGKVKLLLDFLTERQELKCHVRQVSKPMSLPAEDEHVEQPAPVKSPDEKSAPAVSPESPLSPPQKKPEVSDEGRSPAVR